MQIKIEIDVKPEELRTFLGLPDVAGLQEELILYVREKMSQGIDGFDPSTFVKENFDTLKGSKAWQRLMSVAFQREAEAAEKKKKASTTRKRTTAKKTTRK